MITLSNYWFLLRYAVVGVSGGVLQTATLYVWVELLRLQEYYLSGSAIGFCLALMVTFTLQKYWTFKDYEQAMLQRQFTWYTTIALVNLGANVSLLHISRLALEALGLNFFHVWYLMAQIGIIIILAILSFTTNYLITFRKRHA